VDVGDNDKMAVGRDLRVKVPSAALIVMAVDDFVAAEAALKALPAIESETRPGKRRNASRRFGGVRIVSLR
jgi:hypothetical protein